MNKRTPVANHCVCSGHVWAAASGGHVVLVSTEDAWLLKEYAWCKTTHAGGRTSYAQSRAARIAGVTLLHKAIFPNVMVDHVNGHGMDNRRENLRPVTQTQNNANSRKRNDTSSAYKGVCWKYDKRKWKAYIFADGRQRHIGYFANEADAARAYDMAAIRTFGEYARPNFNQRED